MEGIGHQPLVSTCTGTYVHACTHMRMCTHIYTYEHVYTHTYTLKRKKENRDGNQRGHVTNSQVKMRRILAGVMAVVLRS